MRVVKLYLARDIMPTSNIQYSALESILIVRFAQHCYYTQGPVMDHGAL